MGTWGSPVTSWRMIACGKIGANASGPTGSRVAGSSGGSSWKGRSGTRLYQLSGMAFSSRGNFVCCISRLRWLAVSHQLTAFCGVRSSESATQRQGFDKGRSQPERLWLVGEMALALSPLLCSGRHEERVIAARRRLDEDLLATVGPADLEVVDGATIEGNGG